jgi:hypothetical protein
VLAASLHSQLGKIYEVREVCFVLRLQEDYQEPLFHVAEELYEGVDVMAV